MNHNGTGTMTALTVCDDYDDVMSIEVVGGKLDVLRQRADSLRRTAGAVHPILAQAYSRRASELDFEVWLEQLRAGLEVDPIAA